MLCFLLILLFRTPLTKNMGCLIQHTGHPAQGGTDPVQQAQAAADLLQRDRASVKCDKRAGDGWLLERPHFSRILLEGSGTWLSCLVFSAATLVLYSVGLAASQGRGRLVTGIPEGT